MIFGREPETYIVYIHAVSRLCWHFATFVDTLPTVDQRYSIKQLPRVLLHPNILV